MNNTRNKPIGYSWIKDYVKIKSLCRLSNPHPDSYLVNTRREKEILSDGKSGVNPVWSQSLLDSYSSMGIVEHMCYALKNEGLDMSILTQVLPMFGETERQEIAHAIISSPKSKDSSARRLGYLYETMTKNEIPLQEGILTKTGYDTLFDPNVYYTLSTPRNISSKFKITDNAIGDVTTLCPIIRRSDSLDVHCSANYGHAVAYVLDTVDDDIVDLACDRLALNETRYSFIYERDTDEATSRVAKFKDAMRNMDLEKDYLTEKNLVALQNCIASKYKWDDSFRDYQNFIGAYIGNKPFVSYMPPKPELLRGYMSEVHKMYNALTKDECGLDPVIAGAVIGCYFVLVHPFADGNGRISRFLMQNVWMKRGYNSGNLILPISEALSRGRSCDYVRSLSDITTPMMDHVSYKFVPEIQDGHEYFVPEVTKCDLKAYAYPDMTDYCETIYNLVKDASLEYLPKTVLKTQIAESTKKQLKAEGISIGDKRITKIVDLCILGDGTLSKNKRRQFRDIPAATIDKMQDIIESEYGKYRDYFRDGKVEVDEPDIEDMQEL